MSAENLFGTENELVALDAELESTDTVEDGLLWITLTSSIIETIGMTITVSLAYEC